MILTQGRLSAKKELFLIGIYSSFRPDFCQLHFSSLEEIFYLSNVIESSFVASATPETTSTKHFHIQDIMLVLKLS